MDGLFFILSWWGKKVGTQVLKVWQAHWAPNFDIFRFFFYKTHALKKFKYSVCFCLLSRAETPPGPFKRTKS